MIHVEFGNRRPHEIVGGAVKLIDHREECVTYVNVDGDTYSHESGGSGQDLYEKVARGQTLPQHEIFTTIVHRDGLWGAHSSEPPTWVWSNNEDLERILSEAYDCPRGRPANVEMTHHTLSGPPGVGAEGG